jgi:hypothetical protein
MVIVMNLKNSTPPLFLFGCGVIISLFIQGEIQPEQSGGSIPQKRINITHQLTLPNVEIR